MEHLSITAVLVALAGLAGAWLQAHYGRKVRLKLNNPHGLVEEVEASTTAQLKEVLQLADEYETKHREGAGKGSCLGYGVKRVARK